MTISDLAHLQPIVTSSAHRSAGSPWRTYDDRDPGQSPLSASDSPVPSFAVRDGAERWIAACDRRRWMDVHPLVSASILQMEFVQLSPFVSANRRIARILFQAQLYERGWPVLPWHFAIERNHNDYLDAFESSAGRRSHEPFLAFMLDACAVAVSKGNEMVSALEIERDRLIQALLTDGGVHKEDVRDYAEALLGGVFLEGFSTERGIANDRQLLKRMHQMGHVDSLRSPFGSVYSSPLCRDLMRTSAPQ